MSIEAMDTADWRHSAAATGLLRTFNDAGVIEAADVLVAQRLSALADEPDERVALAVAFVVRAVRSGSVCVALSDVPQQVGIADLPWPATDEWLAAVAGSPLTVDPPALHLDDGLLFLDPVAVEVQQPVIEMQHRRITG